MNDLVIDNNHQVIATQATDELLNIFNCRVRELQLNEREQAAICVNFRSGLYDIASEIVWNRTISVLRDRLSGFGDDFVGDMLGYDKPISADSISEQEVIGLSGDIGIIRSNAKMELLHHAEQIKRYTSREYQMVERITINENQAKALVSDCLEYVLSDLSEGSLRINDIRKRLKTELFSERSEFVMSLKVGEYFEKRTILRSLINLAKTEKEEEKQIVFNNIRIIVPIIWGGLSEKDKYTFGTTYAEISSTESRDYINAIKTVLINVHGFDYVPENLKSNSFISAANNLLTMHYV
jgi:hypothetical protein